MNDERRRILRMLAEGTISVDECQELLQALSDRRTEKVEREVQAAKGKRPIWPYVLLAILAILTIPIWTICRRVLGSVLSIFAGPFGILLFAFWIWMVVDCVKRRPEDFRLLFTGKHEHEKWVWCAIVFLAGWLGALAYLVVVRQPARSLVPPRKQRRESKPGDRSPPPVESNSALAPAPAPVTTEEEPFTPSPRAGSLIPFILVGSLLAFGLPLAIGALAATCGVTAPWIMLHLPPDIRLDVSEVLPQVGGFVGASLIAAFALVLGIMLLWLIIFELWMLIDCLARDHREFGTLITSSKPLDKLLWLLLILMFPIIAGLAYHISIRRSPRRAPGAA